jgi:hypothetical protein
LTCIQRHRHGLKLPLSAHQDKDMTTASSRMPL